VSSVRLRPSARATILDEDDRILLCRFEGDLFAPRALGTLLTGLLTSVLPDSPVMLGL
jgi:hypothetical protein